MSYEPKSTSVDRAIRILLTLAEQDRARSLTELSKELNIPKATVYRILDPLEHHDLVVRDSDKREYSLGIGILRLSDRVTMSYALEKVSSPYLENLAKRSGETANLGVPYQDKVHVLTSIQGKYDQILMPKLGPVAELHCSALGKALISDKTADELSMILDESDLSSHTPNTITSIGELLKELEGVNLSGFSIDNEETEMGLICIGAPIRNWNNEVIAAISISAPKSRVLVENYDVMKQMVIETANEIAMRLETGQNEDRDISLL
jgi:IclR family KDG regulon transcriptional repressor